MKKGLLAGNMLRSRLAVDRPHEILFRQTMNDLHLGVLRSGSPFQLHESSRRIFRLDGTDCSSLVQEHSRRSNG